MTQSLTKVSGGTLSGEGTVRKRLLPTLGRIDTVGERELDIRGGELHTIGTVELARLEGRSADDLDGAGTASVASGHLVVKLGHGTSELEVTELAVHVVRARAGIVSKPDSEVLHGAGVLLHDLDAVKDLSSCLLHLAELTHEVPELGLGGDRVGGEDDHAERLGVGVLLGGSLAANHLVLPHESSGGHRVYLYPVRGK